MDGDGPQVSIDVPRTIENLEEELDMTGNNNRVWLVKVPNFLLERWSQVKTDGQEVGRLRIYDPLPGAQTAPITVITPTALSAPPNSTLDAQIPHEYELAIHNQQTRNLYVFAEKTDTAPQRAMDVDDDDNEQDEGQPARKRRKLREPALLGTVVHECNLTPDVESPSYRAIMRARRQKAEQPKRKTQMLAGSQAVQNMLASGSIALHSTAKFSSFIKTKPKGNTNKMVRLPANQVRDMIFAAFEEYDYWSLKALKDRTQQPEVYIRDLLQDIAQQNKRGPYSGLFSLLPSYKGTKPEGSRVAPTASTSGVKEEDGETPGLDDEDLDDEDIGDLDVDVDDLT